VADGGFPDGGILKGGQYLQWQKDYLDLLAMRDLPVWGLPAAAPVRKRFFKRLYEAKPQKGPNQPHQHICCIRCSTRHVKLNPFDNKRMYQYQA
jgi:hypothetical protein